MALVALMAVMLAGCVDDFSKAEDAESPAAGKVDPLKLCEVSHELPFQRVASNGAVTAVVVKGHDVFDHPDSPRTLVASSLGLIVDDHPETDLRGLGPRAGLVAAAEDGTCGPAVGGCVVCSGAAYAAADEYCECCEDVERCGSSASQTAALMLDTNGWGHQHQASEGMAR